MYEKNILFDESIFLNLEVSKLFAEFSMDLLYIAELDTLFAVSTISFPTLDYPYLRFTGFNINDFRINKEQAQQMKVKLKKRLEIPFLDFTFSNNNNWIFIKDKYALDSLNKKKF